MENKLVAFIKPTPSEYIFEHGTHNGYVAVPPGNKYHGKDYNDYFTKEHGYPVICKDCWKSLSKKERKQY